MMSYQTETFNKEIDCKELNQNFGIEKYNNPNEKITWGLKSRFELAEEKTSKTEASSIIMIMRNRKKKNEEKLSESPKPVDIMKHINICITGVLEERYERRERGDKKNI